MSYAGSYNEYYIYSRGVDNVLEVGGGGGGG